MKAQVRLIWLCILMLCLADTALATVLNAPFQIRVLERPTVLAEGQTGRLVLGITAADDITLQSVDLSGPGWSVMPRSGMFMTVAMGEEAELAFDVTPDGTWQMLVLKFEVNGQAVTKQLDLSPGNIRRARLRGTVAGTGKVISAGKDSGTPIIDQAELMPPVDLDKLPLFLTENMRKYEPAPDKDTEPINVHGQAGFDYDGTFRPVYGATIHIIWNNGLFPMLMGATTTDREGYFSITFQPPPGVALDIYLAILAGNADFVVMEDALIERNVYNWGPPPVLAFAGDTIDYGRLTAEGGYIGALNIVNAMTRANYFLRQHTGISSFSYLDVWWPTGDGASYYAEKTTWNSTADIFIRNKASWSNSTHIHEYGHHFVHLEGRAIEAEYCNIGAFCDDPGWWGNDCHHCGWCPENANVAFSEGFPHWLADVVCAGWYYNEPSNPIGALYWTTTGICLETGNVEDPWTTEGAFASLLHDLTSERYNDDPAYPGFAADMAASPAEVLEVVRTENPISPWQFIFAFKDHYPAYNEKFWQACRNNGFSGIDTTAPVTGTLTSTSHPVFSVSSDNTIGVKVVGSSDDFSGIDGYCLTVNAQSPIAPGYTVTHAYTLSAIQSAPYAPGTYYVTVRTRDRAGNWSSSYQSYGPVTIRDPQPSDLRPEPWTADWAYSVVPKSWYVSSEFVVPADTSPIGPGTYWNACVTNDGEVSVADHASSIMVDGNEVASFSGVVPAWGDHNHVYNKGPLYIRGGRHTFGLVADYNEAVAESNESNNDWGKQWIWQPTIMAYEALYGPERPPGRTGGWDSIDGLTKWYNCFGYRIRTAFAGAPSSWAAVWVNSTESDGDLDIRLHNVSYDATSGFAVNIGASYRPTGCLDAVLINSNNRPGNYFDVGVITATSDTTADFKAQATYGISLNEGVVRTGYLGAEEGMDLYTFTGSAGTNYTVFLEQLEYDYVKGPVWLTWYDQQFASGNLLDYDGIAVTDSSLSLELQFDSILAAQNVHAFAVWRDPAQNDFSSQRYSIVVAATPADLATNQPAEWAAPVVPRSSEDATTVWAPEPTLLYGDQALTYFNYSLVNESVTPVSSVFTTQVFVDGIAKYIRYYYSLGSGEVATYLSTTAQTVRGGRHTLELEADPAGSVVEFDLRNNSYATQYVWKPTYIPAATVVSLPEPPDRTGGWDHIDAGEIMWYNCDGQRTLGWKPSGISNYWGAVAILPGAESDLDLNLHDLAPNARDGFDAPLASSQWSKGHSDFVLINFHNTYVKSYDVGIVQAGAATGASYQIATAASVGLPADPDGLVGTFNMGAEDIVQLYEIEFTTGGSYVAQVVASDPSLDLGFSLYGPDLVQGSKSDVLDGTAAAWVDIAAGIDAFDFTIQPAETGKYCLAVWKTGSGPTQSSDYDISIVQYGASGVDPAELPSVSRLTGTYPNPFNPRTTIDFALAADSPTRVTIHDLMGRRIATLVDTDLAAGRHSVAWEGQDDSGRRVASGTYFVRFHAKGVRETSKLMLIK